MEDRKEGARCGVFLGMPGPWADSNYEQADHYSTKIGGLPDWPFPINSTSHDFLKCGTCERNLCLIAQVYAPISCKELTVDERIIYILGCYSPHCENLSWRALRVQKICSIEESILSCDAVAESAVSVSENNFRNDLWSFEPGDENSDDDCDGIDLEELSRAFSEAANITSMTQKQSSDSDSNRKPLPTSQAAIDDKVLVMPCFYIRIQEENFMRKATSDSSKHPLPFVEEDNAEDVSSDEIYEEECYEYDRALNADRTYLKFKKRMDENPEQCLRYSYGGNPLIASAKVGDPGKCRHCGVPRHFEMQLMSPLIYFLQEAADNKQCASVEKLNWLTLLVYTCSKSCSDKPHRENLGGSEGWTVAEEEVLVQYE